MKIAPITNYSKINNSPNFKANLWVDNSVEEVIRPNRANFLRAAGVCDEWLRTDKKDVPYTMVIRKNTALVPNKVAHLVNHLTFAYPFEESGYMVSEVINSDENLEFEMNNKKCGFWFDTESTEDKLLSDFQIMFEHLNR